MCHQGSPKSYYLFNHSPRIPRQNGLDTFRYILNNTAMDILVSALYVTFVTVSVLKIHRCITAGSKSTYALLLLINIVKVPLPQLLCQFTVPPAVHAMACFLKPLLNRLSNILIFANLIGKMVSS